MTLSIRHRINAAALAFGLGATLAACGSGDATSDSAKGDSPAATAAATTAKEKDKESDSKDSDKAKEGTWPRTVATDDGEVTLEKKPERIVSTATTLTGTLLSLGAPVVASGATMANSPEFSDDQGFFSQWSEAAKKAKVEKLWENQEPKIEKVVDYNPDLIVVAKTSGDSVFDHVEELRKVAPVVVVDYSDADWTEVSEMIAVATGTEKAHEEAVKKFEDRLKEVKGKITVPDEEVSPVMVFGDGSGAVALTQEAPQTQILKELGFTIAQIPEEVKGSETMGKRGDIVELSNENLQKGLPGGIWIAVGADPAVREQIEKNPAITSSEQAKSGKIYSTPGETFRLDYYSALMFLDSIEKTFSK